MSLFLRTAGATGNGLVPSAYGLERRKSGLRSFRYVRTSCSDTSVPCLALICCATLRSDRDSSTISLCTSGRLTTAISESDIQYLHTHRWLCVFYIVSQLAGNLHDSPGQRIDC